MALSKAILFRLCHQDQKQYIQTNCVKNPIRVMVYAEQMTSEVAVLFPLGRGLSLSKQREWLKPALQPSAFNSKDLHRNRNRRNARCKLVGLVQAGWNRLIITKPSYRTTALPQAPFNCSATYPELCTETPQDFLVGVKVSFLYNRSRVCTV